MASTYEPIPTTDEETPPKPINSPKRRAPYRKIFLLIVGLLVVAFASFKVGQWSGASAVLKQSLDQPVSLPPPTSTPSNTSEHNTVSKPNSTETTMPDHGKVSVG